jgi:hypothetical protein
LENIMLHRFLTRAAAATFIALLPIAGAAVYSNGTSPPPST